MTSARPPASGLLSIRGLAVTYRVGRRHVEAVNDAGLDVAPGETVAIVGESGSGKSTTAHAVVGLLAPSARIGAGSIVYTDVRGDRIELVGASSRTWRAVRGREIGLVPQDPTVSLNPVTRVGDQVAETLRIHRLAGRGEAGRAAIDALERAGLPEPARRARQYPHELSGGMRQRVLIAIAIAARPRLIVADEPTSALDVTVQRQILDHLEHLTRESGTGVLLITHDLGLAAERANRVAVLSEGRIVETGPSARVLGAPDHPYTRSLIAAAPSLATERPPLIVTRGRPQPAEVASALESDGSPSGHRELGTVPTPLVVADGLVKHFGLRALDGSAATLKAVDGVSLSIERATTLALVGESGSGKSTTARLVLRLTDPTAGTVHFDGRDITTVRGAELRQLRRRLQLVYQNPFTSLNPRFSVEQIVVDPLRSYGVGSRRERRARAVELIDQVALSARGLAPRPGELSGGQRQRVAIARALALHPDLVVLDEPVSALDVSVQAQILELLVDLQATLGLTYLFISHDLAVVRQIAHRVAVMRDGRTVEEGRTADVFARPVHPYTVELVESIPVAGGTRVPSTPTPTPAVVGSPAVAGLPD